MHLRPKTTKWAGVLSIPKAGTCVQLWQWRPIQRMLSLFVSLLLTPLRNEEQRCVRAQSNCLLAFSNTSLVMAVEIADQFVHVHNDPFYTVCIFVYNLSTDCRAL